MFLKKYSMAMEGPGHLSGKAMAHRWFGGFGRKTDDTTVFIYFIGQSYAPPQILADSQPTTLSDKPWEADMRPPGISCSFHHSNSDEHNVA